MYGYRLEIQTDFDWYETALCAKWHVLNLPHDLKLW